jgi:hypothetical protein
VRGRSIQTVASNPKTRGRRWSRIVGPALLGLLVLWGIADYWLNARALRQRLVAMGGGPDDAPLHVVKQYVRRA